MEAQVRGSVLGTAFCTPSFVRWAGRSCMWTGSVSCPGTALCPDMGVCAILRQARALGATQRCPRALAQSMCRGLCLGWDGQLQGTRAVLALCFTDGPPRDAGRARLCPRLRLQPPEPRASHSPGTRGIFRMSSVTVVFENKITSRDDRFKTEFKSQPP